MSGGIKSKVNGKLGCILLADAMCQSIAPRGDCVVQSIA